MRAAARPIFLHRALAGTVIDAAASRNRRKNISRRSAAAQARATVALLEASASWDRRISRSKPAQTES